MGKTELWHRYCQHVCSTPSIGLRVDVSRMRFDDALLDRMAEPIARALDAMAALEGGATSNATENRMVGHYWLRAPELAPDKAISADILATIESVQRFAGDVHSGCLAPPKGDGFFVVLVIGIGGSALGAQFVCDALGTDDDAMLVRFIDNTDPDGIDRILGELGESLAQTLVVIVSKSGSTREVLNAAVIVAAAYEQAGLNFARHAVAVTCADSPLHKRAASEQWLRTFEIWDWVGGRTSVLSAVGLVPAALQGLDVDALLAGARDCDIVTRHADILENPAALLATMWHHAGSGRGEKNMVVLPYRDRLALFGRYLQQLVMESIGKAADRDGNTVHQGLTVYGNKGSTDQHAFLQQLQQGPNDFFVTLIDCLRDRGTDSASVVVEPQVTAGDYLHAFRLGTRDALYGAGREVLSITLNTMDARAVGVLIALFERAVGIYAELINVNAYDQPGVEAGKHSAAALIELQGRVLDHLASAGDRQMTAQQIADSIDRPNDVEDVFHLLEHAAMNPDHGVRRVPATTPADTRYHRG